MIIARVYKKPSARQTDRLPLSTYDEAVARLVQYRLDETVTDEAFSLALQVVADIFWQTDKRVLRDVAVAARKLRL